MSMINLMPPDKKSQITYARRNNFLIRWVIGIMFATAGIFVITGAGLFFLQRDSSNYRTSISESEQRLKEQKEEDTLAKVEDISGSLSLVVNVLSREVLFSKLLPHIGALMPDGTILRGLSLSRDQTGGIDLSIGAVDYESAAQALVNIQDSKSLLFTGADANKINCEGTEEDAPYICTATVRAVLTSDNPFLLLNQGAQ